MLIISEQTELDKHCSVLPDRTLAGTAAGRHASYYVLSQTSTGRQQEKQSGVSLLPTIGHMFPSYQPLAPPGHKTLQPSHHHKGVEAALSTTSPPPSSVRNCTETPEISYTSLKVHVTIPRLAPGERSSSCDGTYAYLHCRLVREANHGVILAISNLHSQARS